MTRNKARDAPLPLVYRIDEDDVIKYVSDEWLSFADENSAPQLTWSSVIGKPLWRFISGAETVQLYRLVFQAVRNKNKGVALPFRCDSPDLRRFMELSISPISEGGIELAGLLLREEIRSPVALPFLPSPAEEKSLLSMCSWCKRIRTHEDEWLEIETAVARMRVFNSDDMPKITHGACAECEATLLTEIEAIHAGGPDAD